jgi:hypothetical protein
MAMYFIIGILLIIGLVGIYGIWADGTLSFEWLNENISQEVTLFFGLILISPIVVISLYLLGKAMYEFLLFLIALKVSA